MISEIFLSSTIRLSYPYGPWWASESSIVKVFKNANLFIKWSCLYNEFLQYNRSRLQNRIFQFDRKATQVLY